MLKELSLQKFLELKVFHNISSEIPKNCVATVGFFDGVHIGHQYIIREIKQKAKLRNTAELVVTMTPHPAEFFGRTINLLSSHEEKIGLMENFGVENLLILDFNSELASLTGTQFIDDLLFAKLSVAEVVLGYNNSIGRKVNGVADIASTKIPVSRLQKFSVNSDDDISSSQIRNLLAEGNLETANNYLGYEYSLCGRVVHGFGIGQTISFPTANIELGNSKKCIPANGVYLVEAYIGGQKFAGMLNIGVRPTFGGDTRTIELHILDYSADLYDAEVKVVFKKRLRAEQKFLNTAELVEQLNKDKQQAEKFFRKNLSLRRKKLQ